MELYVTKLGGVSNQPLARILSVTSLNRIIYIMLKKLSIKSLKTYKTSYKPNEISNMIFERFIQKLKKV